MNRQNKPLRIPSLMKGGRAFFMGLLALVMVGCLGRGGGEDFNHVPPEDSGVDWRTEAINDPVDTNDVYIVFDVGPEFPGGDDAMFAFLQENIRYPEEARENGIEGSVFVKFIVERDGSISNPELLRDIGDGCGEEALRLVAKMPKWKPGTERDTVVRCQYFIRVEFSLEK
ncbi:MAG: energy transducer TonB [Bacteroidales bacterium]|nr:energy transducer TonB [Bacteroidales bacterium]